MEKQNAEIQPMSVKTPEFVTILQNTSENIAKQKEHIRKINILLDRISNSEGELNAEEGKQPNDNAPVVEILHYFNQKSTLINFQMSNIVERLSGLVPDTDC